jgi:hypothetical protein
MMVKHRKDERKGENLDSSLSETSDEISHPIAKERMMMKQPEEEGM